MHVQIQLQLLKINFHLIFKILFLQVSTRYISKCQLIKHSTIFVCKLTIGIYIYILTLSFSYSICFLLVLKGLHLHWLPSSPTQEVLLKPWVLDPILFVPTVFSINRRWLASTTSFAVISMLQLCTTCREETHHQTSSHVENRIFIHRDIWIIYSMINNKEIVMQ